MGWKGNLIHDLSGREEMSTVAVIVLVVVAILLLAMLIAGLRRAKAARHAHDGADPYRSHAEASRDHRPR
jgi:hypothetical protein